VLVSLPKLRFFCISSGFLCPLVILLSFFDIYGEKEFYLHFDSPSNNSMISKNFVEVRLSTEKHEIAYVKLYAEFTYQSEISANAGTFSKKVFLKQLNEKPFEFIWKCDTLADQQIRLLAVPYNEHHVILDTFSTISTFILDRNMEFSKKVFKSFYSKKNMVIDADAEDWPGVDSIFFQNNDNSITVKSVWNKSFLYFFIQVKDRYIMGDTARFRTADYYQMTTGKLKQSGPMMALWNWDDVELCFDFKKNRNFHRDKDDLDVLISPMGVLQGNIAFFDSSYNGFISYLWKNNSNHRTVVKGSINNNQDIDTGYTIELAIPWIDFGILPSKGQKFPFDLVNIDRDTKNERKYFISWSGTSWLNNDNATEWGTLLLERPESKIKYYAVGLFAVVLLIFLFIYFSKQYYYKKISRALAKRDDLTNYDSRIQKALNYTDNEFFKNNLMDEIPLKLGLSKPYFLQLFKKELGIPFTHYLIKIRIEKAMEFIQKKEMNFSKIAVKVGFSNSQYFSKTFKRVTGKSPSQYKKETEGHV